MLRPLLLLNRGSLLIAATLAGALVIPLHAQSDNLEDQDQVVQAEEAQHLTPESFESLVYISNKADFLSTSDVQLRCRLELIQSACRLNPIVRQKLLLAGKCDIKRVVDEVEHQKAMIASRAVKPDVRNDGAESVVQELGKRLSQLNEGYPHQELLFTKTLNRLLTNDQQRKYEAEIRASRRARHQAAVDAMVTVIDVVVGMKHEQRKRLTALLLKETRLPVNQADLGEHLVQVIAFQSVQLPPATLRPIFNDRQWTIAHIFLVKLKDEIGRNVADTKLEPKPSPAELRADDELTLDRAPDPKM